MTKPVYQHCPLNRLENRLVRYKEMKTPLELYVPGDALDDWKNNGVREQIIRLKQSYNPSLTLHGPIYGFDPAMRDKAIQELAWSRTQKTFEIAELTNPEVIVFHSSYNDLPYSMHTPYWIDQTTAFWEKAVHQRPSADLRLVIENIFDVNPVPLSTMLKNVES